MHWFWSPCFGPHSKQVLNKPRLEMDQNELTSNKTQNWDIEKEETTPSSLFYKNMSSCNASSSHGEQFHMFVSEI